MADAARPERHPRRDLAETRRQAVHRADGSPWLALLADDNPLNREVGAGLLQALGLQVHTAVDGADAVRKAQSRRYDLVLMDLQMPVLDGLAATRVLRESPGLHSLPVIALTANTSDDDRQACQAAGMDDFLAKPVDLRVLADTLVRWLPER